MKRSKSFITSAAVLLIISMSSCSTEKSEPLFYDDGIVNLMGPWDENTVIEYPENEEGFEVRYLTATQTK